VYSRVSDVKVKTTRRAKNAPTQKEEYALVFIFFARYDEELRG
jgi:hypothetical protein